MRGWALWQALALAACVAFVVLAAAPAGGHAAHAAVAQPPPEYELVDLGAATPFAASEALGVNNRNQIIGDSFPVIGRGQANIEWQVDPMTHAVTASTPPGGVLPRGFADDGSAAGTISAPGGSRAMLWDAAGAVHAIGPLAADGTGNFGLGSDLNPSGLNNHGQTIG